MKKLLLGAAALVAAPLSAQQPTAPPQTAPTPDATVATTAGPPATVPAQPLAPASPATATGAGAVTAAPATSPAEVASIVANEFPGYDRNRDGALDQAEFGDWMLKLKTIADPASTANAAASKTWVNAAFAQADSDRSRSLTLGELTGFLSQS